MISTSWRGSKRQLWNYLNSHLAPVALPARELIPWLIAQVLLRGLKAYGTRISVHTENQDTIVSQLLDLGKKWRADSVEVSDGSNEDYSLRLKRRLRARLESGLYGENVGRTHDAVVISYWWD